MLNCLFNSGIKDVNASHTKQIFLQKVQSLFNVDGGPPPKLSEDNLIENATSNDVMNLMISLHTVFCLSMRLTYYKK